MATSETRFGDFVIARDRTHGDIEVYKATDQRRANPVFYTLDWDRAVAYARKHTPKQPPRWVDRLDHPQD